MTAVPLQTIVPRPDLVVSFLKTVLFRLRQRALRSAVDAVLTALFRKRYVQFLDSRSSHRLIVRNIQGMPMALSTTDLGATPILLMLDRREPVATETYREALVCLDAQSDRPLTVLDVGANIGYYTLLTTQVLGENAKIVAHEPDPRNVRVLEENIHLHDLGDRVVVEQVAVGDQNGTVELALSSSNPGRNQVPMAGIPEAQQPWFDDRIEVESRKIDTLLADNDIATDTVDVVRIDVEGYEQRVLRGMQDVLEAGGPRLLFVEVHQPQLREGGELERFVSLLEGHDFDIVSASDGNHQFDLDSVRDIVDVDCGPVRLVLER